MFSNISQIGPAIAINSSENIDEHIDFIIHKGYVPLDIITDRKHQIFKLFKDKDFKTVAVIITVQYKKAYE